jgi:hypothetical protein
VPPAVESTNFYYREVSAYKMRQTPAYRALNPPPLPVLVKHRTITERSDTDSVVGEPLSVKDDDEGHEVFFEIVSGNEEGMFRISKCNGQIFTVQDTLDFKVKNRYELLITAFDDPGKFKVRASRTLEKYLKGGSTSCRKGDPWVKYVLFGNVVFLQWEHLMTSSPCTV